MTPTTASTTAATTASTTASSTAAPTSTTPPPPGAAADTTAAAPSVAPVETQPGSIRGKVEYREGDGPNIVIRPGPVGVQLTSIDATLSWADGETRGSAAMPIADFRRYLSHGAIQLDA